MDAVRRAARPALLTALLAVAGPLLPTPATAAHSQVDTEIHFPLRLPYEAMDDTWGAPRAGHRHQGTDILAPQMTPVYAAVDGEIIRAEGEDCVDGQYCDDYYLALAGDDGRGYFYVHLNDDTPGRPDGCDGLGGVDNAFAPHLVELLHARGTLEGVRVQAGELIGYTGSSGNADCGVDHIHFEIWNDHDWGSTGKINPYDELVAAIEAGHAAEHPEAGRNWPGHPPTPPVPSLTD